jgi:hypothetical protein
MQCENCGYIFFQPSKKCACCSAPYVMAQSAFEVGQETLFTIFEMAPGEGGIPGDMGMTGEAGAGVEDYNFTDDFDSGETEYGVDENVLDLSDAEAEGFGSVADTGSMGTNDFEFDTSGLDSMPSTENIGSEDFDLNLSDDFTANEAIPTETMEPEMETMEPEAETLGHEGEMDFSGGFDEGEVEGLGFGFDESSNEETLEADSGEISLDASPEPEISLEPELELSEEEPSLEMPAETDLDIDDEQPSLELSDEPSLDIDELDDIEESSSMEQPEGMGLSDELELMDPSEEPELMDPSEDEDLELSDEPELMDPSEDESTEMEDDGGIDFDLDSVDLDEPEDITFEVPEKETAEEESSFDLEGMELEMESPDEPDDEDLTK